MTLGTTVKNSGSKPIAHFQQVQYAFTANIRSGESPLPEGVDARRMSVYRELIYNNIEDLLSSFFPVIHQLLPDEQWLDIVNIFIAQHHCRTPIFGEVPKEFQQFLSSSCETTIVQLRQSHPYLLELAHYEWVELALAFSQEAIAETAPALPHDPAQTKLYLSPLVWILDYQYPVHRISPDYQPSSPQPTYIAVYRDRQYEVQFMELNELSFNLLRKFKTNTENQIAQDTGELLAQFTESLPNIDPERVFSGGLQVIQEWLKRGILLSEENLTPVNKE